MNLGGCNSAITPLQTVSLKALSTLSVPISCPRILSWTHFSQTSAPGVPKSRSTLSPWGALAQSIYLSSSECGVGSLSWFLPPSQPLLPSLSFLILLCPLTSEVKGPRPLLPLHSFLDGLI